MVAIALAALFFVGIHLFIAGTGLRARLVDSIGEPAYLGVFSVLSLGGIVWLCLAWAAAEPQPALWDVPSLRVVVLVLTFFAFELVAIGLTTPSPTATGGEALLSAGDPAKGILRITRHPFLWGVALWGACHVAVNPDPPSLLFFGALVALAVLGPLSIDAKRRRRHGDDWARFAAVTSNVPFAAILAGRNQLSLGELGVWRIALGAALYGVFLAIHPWLFSADPLP